MISVRFRKETAAHFAKKAAKFNGNAESASSLAVIGGNICDSRTGWPDVFLPKPDEEVTCVPADELYASAGASMMSHLELPFVPAPKIKAHNRVIGDDVLRVAPAEEIFLFAFLRWVKDNPDLSYTNRGQSDLALDPLNWRRLMETGRPKAAFNVVHPARKEELPTALLIGPKYTHVATGCFKIWDTPGEIDLIVRNDWAPARTLLGRAEVPHYDVFI